MIAKFSDCGHGDYEVLKFKHFQLTFNIKFQLSRPHSVFKNFHVQENGYFFKDFQGSMAILAISRPTA